MQSSSNLFNREIEVYECLALSVFLHFFPSRMNFRNTSSSTGFLLNSWSKASFTRPPFVMGTFAVSPCLSSRTGHLGKYLHAFINFSHIFAVVRPLQLVKGELGERTFRHIDYKMYTGVVLPGGREPPAFISSLNHGSS